MRAILFTDGENMINILHTKASSGVLRDPFVFDKNCGANTVCVKSGNALHTIIKADTSSEVVNITRVVADSSAEIVDCYQFADGTQWFGGPQLRYQHWPIQHMYYEEEPYVPTHPVNMALSERYWLSGKGVYLYASERSPLFLDQNNYRDKYLCLIAKNKAPYRRRDSVRLDYELGVFANPKVAHQHVVRTHLGKPKGHPNERMIRHPVWSTWARYKANVTEEVVESFADEIIAKQVQQ